MQIPKDYAGHLGRNINQNKPAYTKLEDIKPIVRQFQEQINLYPGKTPSKNWITRPAGCQHTVCPYCKCHKFTLIDTFENDEKGFFETFRCVRCLRAHTLHFESCIPESPKAPYKDGPCFSVWTWLTKSILMGGTSPWLGDV